MPVRNASIEWKGGREGSGAVHLESGADALRYSFPTRFEEEPGSNPEELLAGALGSCFTMALVARLTGAGTPPAVVRTSASATITKVEGEWTVTGLTLRVAGEAEGLSQEAFEANARAAKEGCPISRALKAVPIELVVGVLGT